MDNEKLVEYLMYNGYLKTNSVIKAFLDTPRENFVTDKYKKRAYMDEPLPIGRNQTISAPSMVAIMLEILQLKKKQKVLEIGTGSGWNAALMARIIDPGAVYSLELEPELTEWARGNIKSVGIENVDLRSGDGSFGFKRYSPYDVIVLTCATEEIPEVLFEQLKTNGVLMAPVGSIQQILTTFKKRKDRLEKKPHCGCVFVPLRNHT